MENTYQIPDWIEERAKKFRDWADEKTRSCLESLMPELKKQYISKAKALRMGERMTRHPDGNEVLAIPLDKLIRSPQADVALIQRGKWDYRKRDNKMYCDNCGMTSPKPTPHCPYCGAKMDNMIHNNIPKKFN